MTDARSTDEASEWCRKARELLGKQRAKKLSLKSGLTQAKEANEKFDKRLRQLGEVNGPEQQRQQAVYRKLAGELQALSQANDQVGLKTKLEELDQLQKTVEAEIKKANDLTEAVAKFEKAYAERQVEMAKVRGLRGATLPGSSVYTPLQQAVADLAEARQLGNDAWTMRDATKLTQASDKLKAVTLNLNAAREGVKNVKAEAQADLAAQGEWTRILPLARQGLVELKGLPGAVASATWLQKLIDDSVGLLVNEAGVMHGFRAALDKLCAYTAVIEAGKKESEAYLAKDKPIEVVQALARVTAALQAFEGPAPEFAVGAARQEANELAERGRGDPKAAVKALDALALRIQNETTQGLKDKAAAGDAQTAVNDLIKSLKARHAPESMLANARRAVALVDEGDFKAHQWVAAKAAYERAGRQLKALDDGYKTHGTAWEAKRRALAETAALAQQAMSFPALQHLAQHMLEACAELKKPFDRFEFEASLEAIEKPVVFVTGTDGKTAEVKIADAKTELERRIAAGNTPVGDEGLRTAFGKALTQGHRDVNDAHVATETRVHAFVERIKSLGEEERALLEEEFDARLGTVVAQWQKTASGLTGDLKALGGAVETATKGLRKIADDLEAMELSKLRREIGAIKFRKAQENDSKAPAQMLEYLAWLKEKGVDVAAEEQLVLAQKDAPAKAYGDIWSALRKKEQAHRSAQVSACNKLRQEMDDEVRTAMQDLQISAGYKKELVRAGRDIDDLINTRDMDLVDVARGMKERLKTHVNDINATPELHEENKKALDALGERIGEITKHMPATGRRLQQRHIEELAESKRCAPKALKARIALLEHEVADGEQGLKDRELAKAEYRRHKTEAREAYAALKEEAGEGDAFDKWFDARIADAKALKATEGGIPDAIKVIEGIKARIKQIRESSNPRAAMAEANSQEQQAHRLMLDLSRQWQQELASFLSDTLEQAKAALAESEEGDASTIQGLEDLANGAGKHLEPYLKNLTTLGIGALSGPDLKKMKADFARAQATLANARASAQRLIAAPQSTNVQGPSKDGITRLHKKWSERTRAYAASLTNVARAVGEAAAAESDTDLKRKGTEAAQMITSLVSLFQAEAFAAPFGELLRDADGDQAIERLQLAARETVLRQMRQYRVDLANPLLRKLASRANPIDSTSVLVAISGLETTLKEIELQALASA
ncbi:MAG: hypothetical protein JO006_15440 [Paucibacter sp.]|nr:hypothetical protein [Roseateles sp.]